MRYLIPALKEDLNVAVVFQHLAENYVNKVKMMMITIVTLIVIMIIMMKIG